LALQFHWSALEFSGSADPDLLVALDLGLDAGVLAATQLALGVPRIENVHGLLASCLVLTAGAHGKQSPRF
jgi:hypothetical protein